MPRSYKEKSREINRSLVRRARLRKAYFKMLGEDAPKPKASYENNDENNDEEINIEDEVDSEEEDEQEKPVKAAKVERPTKQSDRKPFKREPLPPLPTKKQLAKQRRQEAYHEFKEREQARETAEKLRHRKANTMNKRTIKGQPKLGARVGLLLDKIQKSQD